MDPLSSANSARRRLLAGFVMGILLVGGVGVAVRHIHGAAAGVSSSLASRDGEPPIAVDSDAPAVPPRAARSAGSLTSRGLRVPGPGELEVCHGEPVALGALSVLGSDRFVAVRAQAKALVDPMRFHPDPAMRAAGLLLGDRAARVDALAEADRAASSCTDQACVATAWQGAMQRHRHLTSHGLADLVDLALGSRDTATYALAAQWCATSGQEVGACRQVSLAEWAQRDPDNMAAWLRLAQQADERKDADARDEALFRAVAASRQDHHHGAVVRAALAALSDGTDALVQQHLLGLALDVRDSTLQPVFNMAAACEPAGLRDTNRWQRCDGLADALTRRGTTMLELRIGLRIGRAVGWSADRVAALEQEAQAMTEAHLLTLGMQPGLSCPALQVFRQFVAETGEHGELATARAMAARTGRTPAELAVAHRERMAALQAAARR